MIMEKNDSNDLNFEHYFPFPNEHNIERLKWSFEEVKRNKKPEVEIEYIDEWEWFFDNILSKIPDDILYKVYIKVMTYTRDWKESIYIYLIGYRDGLRDDTYDGPISYSNEISLIEPYKFKLHVNWEGLRINCTEGRSGTKHHYISNSHNVTRKNLERNPKKVRTAINKIITFLKIIEND